MLSAIRNKKIAHLQALSVLSFSEVKTSLGFFQSEMFPAIRCDCLVVTQSSKYCPAFLCFYEKYVKQ